MARVRKVQLPWVGQPQEIADPAQSWIDRGMVALFDTVHGVELISNSLASVRTALPMAAKDGAPADFSTTYQRYAHRPAYAQTGPCTIAMVLDVDALTNYGHLIAKQRTNGNDIPFELRLGSGSGDSRVNLTRASASSSGGATGSGSDLISAGSTSVLLIASMGFGIGPAFDLWIDGKKYSVAANDDGTGASDDGASDLWIGQRQDGVTQLDGRIYYAALFDRQFSDAMASELTADRFSIYESGSIWVPVSSGGAASPVAANATYYQMIAQQRIGY